MKMCNAPRIPLKGMGASHHAHHAHHHNTMVLVCAHTCSRWGWWSVTCDQIHVINSIKESIQKWIRFWAHATTSGRGSGPHISRKSVLLVATNNHFLCSKNSLANHGCPREQKSHFLQKCCFWNWSTFWNIASNFWIKNLIKLDAKVEPLFGEVGTWFLKSMISWIMELISWQTPTHQHLLHVVYYS